MENNNKIQININLSIKGIISGIYSFARVIFGFIGFCF